MSADALAPLECQKRELWYLLEKVLSTFTGGMEMYRKGDRSKADIFQISGWLVTLGFVGCYILLPSFSPILYHIVMFLLALILYATKLLIDAFGLPKKVPKEEEKKAETTDEGQKVKEDEKPKDDSEKPKEKDSGKPVETHSGIPKEKESGKPVETHSGIPKETGSEKPKEKDSGKPVETHSGIPKEEESEKPKEEYSKWSIFGRALDRLRAISRVVFYPSIPLVVIFAVFYVKIYSPYESILFSILFILTACNSIFCPLFDRSCHDNHKVVKRANDEEPNSCWCVSFYFVIVTALLAIFEHSDTIFSWVIPSFGYMDENYNYKNRSVSLYFKVFLPFVSFLVHFNVLPQTPKLIDFLYSKWNKTVRLNAVKMDATKDFVSKKFAKKFMNFFLWGFDTVYSKNMVMLLFNIAFNYGVYYLTLKGQQISERNYLFYVYIGFIFGFTFQYQKSDTINMFWGVMKDLHHKLSRNKEPRERSSWSEAKLHEVSVCLIVSIVIFILVTSLSYLYLIFSKILFYYYAFIWWIAFLIGLYQHDIFWHPCSLVTHVRNTVCELLNFQYSSHGDKPKNELVFRLEHIVIALVYVPIAVFLTVDYFRSVYDEQLNLMQLARIGFATSIAQLVWTMPHQIAGCVFVVTLYNNFSFVESSKISVFGDLMSCAALIYFLLLRKNDSYFSRLSSSNAFSFLYYIYTFNSYMVLYISAPFTNVKFYLSLENGFLLLRRGTTPIKETIESSEKNSTQQKWLASVVRYYMQHKSSMTRSKVAKSDRLVVYGDNHVFIVTFSSLSRYELCFNSLSIKIDPDKIKDVNEMFKDYLSGESGEGEYEVQAFKYTAIEKVTYKYPEKGDQVLTTQLSPEVMSHLDEVTDPNKESPSRAPLTVVKAFMDQRKRLGEIVEPVPRLEESLLCYLNNHSLEEYIKSDAEINCILSSLTDLKIDEIETQTPKEHSVVYRYSRPVVIMKVSRKELDSRLMSLFRTIRNSPPVEEANNPPTFHNLKLKGLLHFLAQEIRRGVNCSSCKDTRIGYHNGNKWIGKKSSYMDIDGEVYEGVDLLGLDSLTLPPKQEALKQENSPPESN